MKNQISKKEWQSIQSLLLQRCNTGYEPTHVEVKLNKGNRSDYCLDVLPLSEAGSRSLHCIEEVVDVVRAFNLSLWVGYNPEINKVVAHIF